MICFLFKGQHGQNPLFLFFNLHEIDKIIDRIIHKLKLNKNRSLSKYQIKIIKRHHEVFPQKLCFWKIEFPDL